MSLAILKHIEKLKQANIIKRIGSTRGYWKIIDSTNIDSGQ
jgi:predicted transcriptional regulator